MFTLPTIFAENGKVWTDGLQAFLRRHRRIALDTSVFIYQLEANPRYVDLSDRIFIWIWLGQPNHTGITSTITMTVDRTESGSR